MFSRRDFLKLSGAALLAAAFPHFETAQAEGPSAPPTIWQGSKRHRYVALTYDDCNWLYLMQDLEKLLAEYPDIRITLFPTGENLLSKESQDHGIWNRFYDQGHEIGYHSYYHVDPGVMSLDEVLNDFDKWNEALVKVMGFQPKIRFARPVGGNYVSRSFINMCALRGLVLTMWSGAGGGETAAVMNNTFTPIRNGDIVLFHIRRNDIETTRAVFPYLKEQGVPSVTLSKLYDDLLIEQNQSEGCDVDAGSPLTRTCIE